MSDGEHRIMMNDYTNNINNILKKECPDGVTIDQFKKKIVTGELKLSGEAQEAITTYAAPSSAKSSHERLRKCLLTLRNFFYI